jgi:hypothetical protein
MLAPAAISGLRTLSGPVPVVMLLHILRVQQPRIGMKVLGAQISRNSDHSPFLEV